MRINQDDPRVYICERALLHPLQLLHGQLWVCQQERTHVKCLRTNHDIPSGNASSHQELYFRRITPARRVLRLMLVTKTWCNENASTCLWHFLSALMADTITVDIERITNRCFRPIVTTLSRLVYAFGFWIIGFVYSSQYSSREIWMDRFDLCEYVLQVLIGNAFIVLSFWRGQYYREVSCIWVGVQPYIGHFMECCYCNIWFPTR